VKGFELTKKIGLVAVLGLGLFFSLAPAHGSQTQAATASQGSTTQAGGEQATPLATHTDQESEQELDEGAQYKHSKMVQAIGHAMGMSTETASVVFEFLNFAVLAALLIWALAKTLPKFFRDRTSVLQKELADARSATEEASVRLNSVEERLAKLDGQIAAMKEQAEKDAVGEEQRFRAAAEEEKNKILASAEQEIASATQQAQRQLQQYAAGLAVEQAAKRLVITAETDRLLIKTFAQRLGLDQGSGDKGGQN
jgi:F-type H+-transporting ATPase subunit b